MEVKTRCITLRTIKYKDNQSIVTCLSRELGRVALLARDGSGRESRRRRALMMPGGAFDCVVDSRESRTVQTFRDVSAVRPMLIDNSVKAAIVLFICDFLNSLMRDSQPDERLFDYVDMTLGAVVESTGPIANAPICFLMGLQPLMGIEPDISTYRRGYCFDMHGGVFTPTPPLSGRFLSGEEAEALVTLSRMRPRTMGLFKMSREQRREALDMLLDYYTIHFGGLRTMNSLEVVRSLFD